MENSLPSNHRNILTSSTGEPIEPNKVRWLPESERYLLGIRLTAEAEINNVPINTILDELQINRLAYYDWIEPANVTENKKNSRPKSRTRRKYSRISQLGPEQQLRLVQQVDEQFFTGKTIEEACEIVGVYSKDYYTYRSREADLKILANGSVMSNTPIAERREIPAEEQHLVCEVVHLLAQTQLASTKEACILLGISYDQLRAWRSQAPEGMLFSTRAKKIPTQVITASSELSTKSRLANIIHYAVEHTSFSYSQITSVLQLEEATIKTWYTLGTKIAQLQAQKAIASQKDIQALVKSTNLDESEIEKYLNEAGLLTSESHSTPRTFPLDAQSSTEEIYFAQAGNAPLLTALQEKQLFTEVYTARFAFRRYVLSIPCIGIPIAEKYKEVCESGKGVLEFAMHARNANIAKKVPESEVGVVLERMRENLVPIRVLLAAIASKEAVALVKLDATILAELKKMYEQLADILEREPCKTPKIIEHTTQQKEDKSHSDMTPFINYIETQASRHYIDTQDENGFSQDFGTTNAKVSEHLQAIKDLYRVWSEARKPVFEANTRLVVNLTKQFSAIGLSKMELIDAGNEGLMEAIDTFDITRKIRFTTYAKERIKNMIRKRIERHNTIQATEVSLSNVNTKEEERINALEMIAETYDPEPIEVKDFSHIYQALETLNERERKIIMARIGLEYGMRDGEEKLISIEPATLQNLAETFGVTKERIRQIEAKVHKKLKNALAAEI